MPSGSADISLSVPRARQFSDLGKACRAVARKDLKLALTRNVRAAGTPVLAAVKASAATIPDRSPVRRRDGKSARALLAGAVRLQVRARGITFVVDEKKLPDGFKNMGKAFEARQFRHPVWARQDRTRGQWAWVTQEGHPWFYPPIRKAEPAFLRAIDAAMQDCADQIERSV